MLHPVLHLSDRGNGRHRNSCYLPVSGSIASILVMNTAEAVCHTVVRLKSLLQSSLAAAKNMSDITSTCMYTDCRSGIQGRPLESIVVGNIRSRLVQTGAGMFGIVFFALGMEIVVVEKDGYVH